MRLFVPKRLAMVASRKETTPGWNALRNWKRPDNNLWTCDLAISAVPLLRSNLKIWRGILRKNHFKEKSRRKWVKPSVHLSPLGMKEISRSVHILPFRMGLRLIVTPYHLDRHQTKGVFAHALIRQSRKCNNLFEGKALWESLEFMVGVLSQLDLVKDRMKSSNLGLVSRH